MGLGAHQEGLEDRPVRLPTRLRSKRACPTTWGLLGFKPFRVEKIGGHDGRGVDFSRVHQPGSELLPHSSAYQRPLMRDPGCP
jgi:hypothetical protein